MQCWSPGFSKFNTNRNYSFFYSSPCPTLCVHPWICLVWYLNCRRARDLHQVRTLRHLPQELSEWQPAVCPQRQARQVHLQDPLRLGLPAQGDLHPGEDEEGVQMPQRSAQLPRMWEGLRGVQRRPWPHQHHPVHQEHAQLHLWL